MALKVGDKAPTFSLFDFNKQKRSLDEFLGKKTILAFYPGAFTGACTSEMCALRDALSEFNRVDAHVVGVSVDSPFANKAFSEVNKLGFPLLSDFDRAVSKQYCGLYDGFGGLPGYTAAKRSVFILDPGGVVRYVWSTENPGTEPDYDAVKEALRSV